MFEPENGGFSISCGSVSVGAMFRMRVEIGPPPNANVTKEVFGAGKKVGKIVLQGLQLVGGGATAGQGSGVSRLGNFQGVERNSGFIQIAKGRLGIDQDPFF